MASTDAAVPVVEATGSAGAHPPRRLDFLDVLRGLAALTVALYHLGNAGPVRADWFDWFSHEPINLGSYGVLLFFLVSGFIIPASLERGGSLRDFWIGRFFRLVPLFWVVTGAVMALYVTGLLTLPGYVFSHKYELLVGNVTLMSHFVGASFLIGPAWTLPFEICFYALTSVLFVTRLGRRSSIAVALAGGALALLAFNSAVPASSLTPDALGRPGYEGEPLRVVLLAALVAVAAMLLSRSRTAALYTGVVGFVAILLLLNRPWPLHETAIYITIMFTGTVIHRVANGSVAPRIGWSVVGVVTAACCVSLAVHTPSTGVPIRASSFAVALIAAVVTFVAAYAVRHRVSWPSALQWLGRISYSFYLVHWVVMKTVPGLPDFTGSGVLTLALWLAITLAISQLTYQYVERPAVEMGRLVVRALRAPRVSGWQRLALTRTAKTPSDVS